MDACIRAVDGKMAVLRLSMGQQVRPFVLIMVADHVIAH